MPSANKTPNYGLNQWQGNEYPKRTDFVEDNAIIDQKLKEIDGKASSAIQGATFGGEAVPIKGKALDIPMPTAEQIEALPLYKKTVAITKDTTLSSDKSGYLIMVSSANIATVTLPSPSTRAQYDIFSNANPFVLSTSAAIFDLVTGVLGVQTLTIPVWRYIRITTDGASWIILGGDRASYASGSIALTTPALRNIQASSAQASSYLGLGNINVVIL